MLIFLNKFLLTVLFQRWPLYEPVRWISPTAPITEIIPFSNNFTNGNSKKLTKILEVMLCKTGLPTVIEEEESLRWALLLWHFTAKSVWFYTEDLSWGRINNWSKKSRTRWGYNRFAESLVVSENNVLDAYRTTRNAHIILTLVINRMP